MQHTELLQRIHPVSRETVDRIEHFIDLFEKWAQSINLVAASTRENLWSRHVADSLQIFALRPTPDRWVDLGSGGGFPGVITAIALAEEGRGWVDLIESNRKKAAFLRVALAETGARGAVHPVRIETAAATLPGANVVSARALAELDDLLNLASPWMTGALNATAYFHKGRDYARELEKARGRWQFDLVEHRSRLNPESVILQIGHLRPI